MSVAQVHLLEIELDAHIAQVFLKDRVDALRSLLRVIQGKFEAFAVFNEPALGVAVLLQPAGLFQKLDRLFRSKRIFGLSGFS